MLDVGEILRVWEFLVPGIRICIWTLKGLLDLLFLPPK